MRPALQIDGCQRIFVGSKVLIGYKVWLAAEPLTGDPNCRLTIEDGAVIGNFNHIYATSSIIIGRNVITADKVYISDNIHGYQDIDMPISKQPIVQKLQVTIGEGSWLGENVCVIGASIGRHCVIGANSVVTSNVPDYCVAVGIPARVIKRYNPTIKAWEKTL